MLEKIRSFMYLFDFIGRNPHLFIFNDHRYKSLLSFLISLIIILFSIIFSILSIFEYLKFKDPHITYSKYNDEETNRNLEKKDFLLMFQLIDTISLESLNNSIGYYVAEYIVNYNNGTRINIPLDIETCEIGKNIDKKYQDFVNDKSNFGKKVDEFYCISSKFENISLFYDPKVGYSSFNLYVIFQNNSIYTPEKIKSLIIIENNIINHFNRKDPVNNGYIFQLSSAFSSKEFTRVNYIFQYLKYESDDGFIFQNSRTLYGISFTDMVSYRSKEDISELTKNFEEIKDSIVGIIDLEINKSSFDNYKRSYQKLQSLLAEITSVINLLFQIGSQVSFFLGDKKMGLSIIEYLSDKNDLNTKKNIITIIKEKKYVSSERKIIPELSDNSINLDNSKKNSEIKFGSNNKMSENSKNEKNKILKEINYFHIINSFFCFKDKKSQFINFSYNIIKRDMSIERIMERFYSIENMQYYISNQKKKKLKNNKIKKCLQIDKTIDEVNDQIAKEEKLEKKNLMLNLNFNKEIIN